MLKKVKKETRSYFIPSLQRAGGLTALFLVSLPFFSSAQAGNAGDLDLEGAIYGHSRASKPFPSSPDALKGWKEKKTASKHQFPPVKKNTHLPSNHSSVHADHPGKALNGIKDKKSLKPEKKAAAGKPEKSAEKSETAKSVDLPKLHEEVFHPHFAALRANRVYMRRGPGQRYPIDWVYYRRGLPVKVTREFQNWCQVEDSSGEKGWVHQATLRSLRDFVVLPAPSDKANGRDLVKLPEAGQAASKEYDAHVVGYCASVHKRCALGSFPIYSAPDSRDRPVALLLPGAVGKVSKCGGETWGQWCEVRIAGYKGWIERKHLWGALDEDLTSKETLEKSEHKH